MKAAVGGLSNTILDQLELLYNDVKAYADREILMLIPKIDGNCTKCEILEMAASKSAGDITSLRREINDRYDYLLGRMDNLSADMRELKEKQGNNAENILQVREELRRANEKLLNSTYDTNDRIKDIVGKAKQSLENFENLEKKFEKQLMSLNTEVKKNSENFKSKLQETDEKVQENMFRLKGKIEEHTKEIENISVLMTQTVDKLIETKSELSYKQDDLYEDAVVQIKKNCLSLSAFTEKFEKSTEFHNLSLEEINKSFGLRLEALTKNLMNENKNISERLYKGEKDLDRFERETKIAMSSLERGLIIQDEKLNLSLSNKYH